MNSDLEVARDSGESASPPTAPTGNAQSDPEITQLRAELTGLLAPRYGVESYLKSGGAGAVFKIIDNASQASRVAKILRLRARDIAALKEEFLTEAQKLAGLRHPNLVTVFEQSKADATPYFIM
jgi:serine/threonine protein kinase